MNNLKLTYEYVKQQFEKRNCQLISDKYINNCTKLIYTCECGETKSQDFNSFRLNKKCRTCFQQSRHKYVEKFFLQNECKLLSKYINGKTKLIFICHCGKEATTQFDRFIYSKQCSSCGRQNGANKQSLGIEYIKEFFRNNNCVLLSASYYKNSDKLNYICSCGNTSIITFNSFQYGHRCPKCSIEKLKNSQKIPFIKVKNLIKINKYKLLDENYINNSTKLNLICNKGHSCKISFGHFKNGKRCKQCYLDNNKGKNNPNWNPNKTSQERLNQRLLPENTNFRNLVFKRDNYICQICGEHGKRIAAHHLDGYHWFIDGRFNVNNGITLCDGKDSCHKLFHKIYGNKNNINEQFKEFKNSILNSY